MALWALAAVLVAALVATVAGDVGDRCASVIERFVGRPRERGSAFSAHSSSRSLLSRRLLHQAPQSCNNTEAGR